MLQLVRVLALIACLCPLGLVAQTDPPAGSLPVGNPLEYDAPMHNIDADKPIIPSFLRASPSRAGGSANELNTGDSRATEKLPGGDVVATVTGRDLYHGNFCGHGNRGNDKNPTDTLDAACKRHDECFDRTDRSCSWTVLIT